MKSNSKVLWRRSSRSQNNGACVEARLDSLNIATRDSKHPAGGNLVVSRDDWQGFLATLR